MNGIVEAVSLAPGHSFSKRGQEAITLVKGIGVEGDAHAGETVKHRSRVRKDPTQPNLRQVHLIHAELFDDLRADGFDLAAGQIGENVLTRGIDLLGLPREARLAFAGGAIVEITGLRNPCAQLDQFQSGLMKAMIGRDEAGKPVFKAGVMAVVIAGGEIRAGDPITVSIPAEPHRALEIV